MASGTTTTLRALTDLERRPPNSKRSVEQRSGRDPACGIRVEFRGVLDLSQDSPSAGSGKHIRDAV